MGELERCYGLAATGTHSRIIFTQIERHSNSASGTFSAVTVRMSSLIW